MKIKKIVFIYLEFHTILLRFGLAFKDITRDNLKSKASNSEDHYCFLASREGSCGPEEIGKMDTLTPPISCPPVLAETSNWLKVESQRSQLMQSLSQPFGEGNKVM